MTVRKIPTHIKGLEYVEMTDFDTLGGGSFASIRARNIKFKPEQETIRVDVQKPEANRGPDASIPAAEGGTLTFEIAMRGGAGAMSEFAKLAQYLGTVHKRDETSGSKVVSSTNTSVTLLTVDCSDYVTGDIIGVKVGSNDIQLRGITDVTVSAPNTVITVDHAWDNNPTASDDLIDVDTILPGVGEPSKYLAFKLYSGQGATDRHEWLLEGCAGTWKIVTTERGAEPVVEFTFMVDRWTSSEDSTTQSADTYNPAHPLLGDKFTVEGTEIATRNLGFDPALDFEPYDSVGGDNGRIGWLLVGEEPVLEFTPYHDVDWISRWTGATELNIFFESVKDDDEAWCLWCPACQVTDLTHDDAGNKHLSTKPTMVVIDPGKDSQDANICRFAIGITGGGS